MDLHFLDANGNHFVVPDAPEGYVRDDGATLISPPPSPEYHWIDGDWKVPEPTAPPVPQEVTRRQILTALGGLGWITEAEAEAALTTGQRPAVVDAVISQLPEGERFGARMKWAGFQHAYRTDSMVAALAMATDRDDEDIDALFTLAATVE